MSSNAGNSLPKPKVRFTDTASASTASGPFQGPRIREIVTLKRPIKIVPLPIDQQSSPESKSPPPNPPAAPKPPEIPLEPEVIILSPPGDQITPELSQKNSQTLLKPSEDPKPKKKAPIDIEVLQKKLETLKTSEKTPKPPRIVKKTLDSKDKSKKIEKPPPKSVLTSKNSSEKLTNQGRTPGAVKKTGNKENVDVKAGNLKINVRNEGKSSKTVEKKKEICSDVPRRPISSREGGIRGVRPLDNRRKSGGKELGLMPCMKGGKIKEKGKVKVDVMRDVSRPLPSVFVGSGRPREREIGPSRGKSQEIKGIIDSGEQLDRPEYNSIICTIRKMEEAKKKKIVGDMQTLPTVYKDLLNEKMSSALDFPPCESVYHDLVDISIDEKQLPMRLTRTKDPEPRPKDFAPRLADFFSPQFAEDYSVAVRVKPRAPEVVDNWSGFRISDKMKAWKTSLDGSWN